MEEMKIALGQSQYEPPATIRQAQINLDKAERAYEQARMNYALKVKQAQADMTEVKINLAKQERTKQEMEDVLSDFDIYAPAPGMVIYKREWNGQKRTVGSEINPWDLTVATLPDLSTLVSKTYVNEIDISKVTTGQNVRLGVDAFPEKKFTGKVIDVANIGEQLPNTDAKVFEVTIRLNENDTILRPSMTTSNQIVTSKYTMYFPSLWKLCIPTIVLRMFTQRKAPGRLLCWVMPTKMKLLRSRDWKKVKTFTFLYPTTLKTFGWTGLDLMEVIKQKKAEEEQKEERNGRNGLGRKRTNIQSPAKEKVILIQQNQTIMSRILS